MEITKEFEGLVRAENGDYVLKGDLICYEDLEIDLDDRLVVTGGVNVSGSIMCGDSLRARVIHADESIYVMNCISSYGSISADQSIRVGCHIESKKDIKAGWFLTAGGEITARGFIKACDCIIAGMNIEAGSFICAGKRIFAGIDPIENSKCCRNLITCAELRSGEICYGELYIRH